MQTAAALLGLVLLACAATGAVACQQEQPQPNAVFASPSGLALAGTEPLASCTQEADDPATCSSRRLFVSNLGEDSLHVLEMSASFAELSFVRSPAQYFNLRIPAGPSPSALASTANGRWVVVLNAGTDALRLVDANALSPVRCASDDALDACVAGEVYTYAIGAPLSRPTGLVASPLACDAPCAGRLFLALAGQGAVVELEVEETAAGPRIRERGLWVVGGQPHQLALSPDGATLFAADASAEEIIRVELATAAIDRRPLGALAGALAVSRDGTLLLVSRPEMRDLVVFEDPTGVGFAIFDADASHAKAPTCVSACEPSAGGGGGAGGAGGAGGGAGAGGSLGDACLASGQHPADAAVCASASGWETTGTPYTAIPIGEAPTLIATLGVSDDPEHALHAPGCSVELGGATQTRVYSEWAALVRLGGLIDFVTLRAESGALDVGVMNAAWCQSATLSDAAADDNVAPADILAPCPEHPARAAYRCAGDHVVVLPGVTGTRTVSFDWEGVVLVRAAGGGALEGTLDLLDEGVPFNEARVDIGDWLSVLSTPSQDPECVADVGEEAAACVFERRITTVAADAEGALRLSFDRPLPPACFPNGVAYQVRAGGQFLVRVDDGGAQRVAPGEVMAPASSRQAPFLVQIRGDLDARLSDDPCARLGDDGLVTPLLRDVEPLPVFVVDDALDRVASGFDFDSDGQPLGPVGRLPAAIVIDRTPDAGAIFVSYSGTGAASEGRGIDLVLGLKPFTALETNQFAEDAYVTLR